MLLSWNTLQEAADYLTWGLHGSRKAKSPVFRTGLITCFVWLPDLDSNQGPAD